MDSVGNLESAQSLIVKIDTTPPTMACNIAPDSLWPPNHKLIPVNATTVTVTTRGQVRTGFELISASSSGEVHVTSS